MYMYLYLLKFVLRIDPSNCSLMLVTFVSFSKYSTACVCVCVCVHGVESSDLRHMYTCTCMYNKT